MLKASALVLKSLEISAYVQRLNGIKWNEILRSLTQQKSFYAKSRTLRNHELSPHPVVFTPLTLSDSSSGEILSTCERHVLLGVNAEKNVDQNPAKDFGSCSTGQS